MNNSFRPKPPWAMTRINEARRATLDKSKDAFDKTPQGAVELEVVGIPLTLRDIKKEAAKTTTDSTVVFAREQLRITGIIQKQQPHPIHTYFDVDGNYLQTMLKEFEGKRVSIVVSICDALTETK